MAEARRDLKALPSVEGARFLVVEARYYDGIGEMLLTGATRMLESAGAKWDVVNVPGALEIPAAIRMLAKGGAYAGAVALGCVIRGETYHFEIVAGESSRAIMDITVSGHAARRQRHPDGRKRSAGHRARRSGAGRQGRRRRARRDHAPSSAQARGACLMAARHRSAARLAAVQALYQMEVAGKGINEILAEFESHWIGGEIEGEQYEEADLGLFRDIVKGVLADQVAIDRETDATLQQGWPLRRVEAVMRAVLRAAGYELRGRADVPARVVITEYVDVAAAFLGADEVGMINAVLDKLARKIRAQEFAPRA